MVVKVLIILRQAVIFPVILKNFFVCYYTRILKAIVIEFNLSLSLNFNSSNPSNFDIPSANEAATNRIGSSSISLGIIVLLTETDFNFELDT